MLSLTSFRCPFRLIRRCFLGTWICLLVQEGFLLEWRCPPFGYSTYIPFCVPHHTVFVFVWVIWAKRDGYFCKKVFTLIRIVCTFNWYKQLLLWDYNMSVRLSVCLSLSIYLYIYIYICLSSCRRIYQNIACIIVLGEVIMCMYGKLLRFLIGFFV